VSLPAGTQIGKYVIQRKLAEGGMAEIFLASSFGPEGFEKQVIIKRVRPSLADDAAFVDMFVSEARLVSRLNHPNIVQIFDFARHENTYYIAMEYVRGKSLAQAHQKAAQLGIPILPGIAVRIVAEVARALSFAHRVTERGQFLGLVHRDVTPQNILLSYDGAVKLTDFGIAKAGTRASTVGMLKGKFAYMSPEQARGDPVDARTDLFALGITLWELLCGRRLFEAESDTAVLRAVQERVVVPPDQLNPAVAETLSAIVMRSLDRDRTARFQSALELERALSRFLGTSEDTDLGAWMRELFPIEASRTENTGYERVPTPGRLDVPTSTVPPSPGMGGREMRALGPVELLGGGHASTEARLTERVWPSLATEHENSADTPVVSPEDPAAETGRLPRVSGLRRLGATAVVLTLAAIAIATLWNRKPAQPAPGKPPIPASLTAADAPTPAQRSDVSPPLDALSAPAPKAPTVMVAPKAPKAAGPKRPLAVHPLSKVPEVPPIPSPASGAPGTLVLTVNPWGDVFIDGKKMGEREQVGRAEYLLPPGDHQVEVQGPSNWGPKLISIQTEQTTSQAVLLK